MNANMVTRTRNMKDREHEYYQCRQNTPVQAMNGSLLLVQSVCMNSGYGTICLYEYHRQSSEVADIDDLIPRFLIDMILISRSQVTNNRA